MFPDSTSCRTCKHLAQAGAGDLSSCVCPAPMRYLAQSSSRCHGRGTFTIRDIRTGQPRLRLAKEPAQGHTTVSGKARLEHDPHMACILSTLPPRFPDCLRNVPPCRIRPGPSDSGHAVNLGGFQSSGTRAAFPGWQAWSLEAGPSRQGGPHGGRRQGCGVTAGPGMMGPACRQQGS